MLRSGSKAVTASIVAAAALASALFLSSCYVGSEGSAYLSIISKAVSLDRALADPKTGAETRALIEGARRARAFAVAELGLKDTRNYRSIVTLDSDRLATVVQACAELSFDNYLWSYPLVGKLPYRGYFDKKDAEKEAERLKKKGLDVIARPVDAFSTLGFLADPLFSFMSSYDEGEVADLVIHEMTHATVFLKGGSGAAGGDSARFNEELATFVGRRGSLLLLEKEYGSGSPEAAAAREEREDSAAFAAYLAGTAKALGKIYASGASDEEKRRLKAETIAARAGEYERSYGSLFKSDRYKAFAMGRINNAYIALYMLYEGDSPLYGDFCEKVCGGDLRAFVEAVSRIARDPAVARGKADPKVEMARLLAQASPEATR
jgi:predicted aminopeptidase